MKSTLHRAVWLSALLLVLFKPQIQAQDQPADDLRIRFSYNNLSLDLAFLDLKINYRLQFEFNEADIRGIRVTSYSTGKMYLKEGLALLLKGTGLKYELKAPRSVVISRYDPAAEEQVAASAFQPEKYNFSAFGTIKDANTGETLPFANVLVRGTTNGTSANVDGYFTLFDIPSDTAVLEITYLGYHTRYFRLQPGMNMEKLLIEMQDMSQQLAEVVVVAEEEEKLLKASTGISKMTISPLAMATLPSFGEKDIFRSLQLLPGISGSNESSSGLYVRGGTPDQNLVLFDGFTVYHVDHLFGFFSAFNANAIKDVQLYKGGFDAKYGGRISSVVDLTGKDGNTEQFNTGFGLSLLSINAFAEAPFDKKKGSFLVAGRRSFQSNFYGNLFDSFTQNNQNTPEAPQGGPPGGFARQNVRPNSFFYDLNAKATYRPNSKDILSFSMFNGQDNLDNSRDADDNLFRRFGQNLDFNFQRTSTDLTNWGNWGTSGKWSRRWSDTFYSNANLSYSNYYSERDRGDVTNITRSDSSFTVSNGNYEYNNLQDYTLKLDNEWKTGKNNQIEFGLQSTYQDIVYRYTQNDTLDILNRADKGRTHAFYLQDRLVLAEKLILKGGLRTTHYGVTGKFYFEPRASLSWLLTDKFKLKGAWGLYNQFATRVVREDIQQGSRDFWLLADDERAPISSAEHYIAGAAYETPKYLVDLEFYYKNLEGLTEYTTRFVPVGFGPDRTLNYEEFFYTGDGKAKGMELLLQKKTGRLSGWVGYTLSEVKYNFAAFGDAPFYANQDQTHELKVVGNYRLNERFTFGATFIYATGKPYTAPTGYYQLQLLDGSTADFFEVSGKNALRLPDYHRFDISATYDFHLGRTKANLGLSIFNLYNRRNVWYKEYDIVEGELLETNVSLLSLTPSLFFNWTLK